MLCDKKIPIKLKGKVYPMVVRLACCTIQSVRPIKNALVHRRLVVEMRMIRWMCSHTRFNRIKNEVFRKKVGVAPIEDKMRETRLKYFWSYKEYGRTSTSRCTSIYGISPPLLQQTYIALALDVPLPSNTHSPSNTATNLSYRWFKYILILILILIFIWKVTNNPRNLNTTKESSKVENKI